MRIVFNFNVAAHVLRSMQEICVFMGAGRATVQEWISQGAPIAVEGEGRQAVYSAEAGELQRWRFERSRLKDSGGLSG